MKIGQNMMNVIAGIAGPAIFNHQYAPAAHGRVTRDGKPVDIVAEQWHQQGPDVRAENEGYPTSPLATAVSKYYVNAYTGKAPDFNIFTENSSREMADLGGANYITMRIQVNEDAGDATREPSDWEDTEQSVRYEDVRVGRVNRAFSMTMNDMANGLLTPGLIAGAAHSVILGIAQKGYDVINKSVSDGDVGLVLTPDVANFNRKWVKQNLVGALGVYNEIDATVLGYNHYQQLLPDNTFDWQRDGQGLIPNLSIGRLIWGSEIFNSQRANTGLRFLHTLDADGATAEYTPTISQPYGKVTYPAGMTGKAVGLICQKRAMQFVPRVPLIHSVNNIAVSSLGVYPGVGELLLKMWTAPGQEKIWWSVEAAVGYKMIVPGAMKVLTTQLPA